MMEAITLARPYARAAFEVANQGRALDAWSAHLGAAAALAGDSRLAGFGNDPHVTPQRLATLYRPTDVADDTPFAHFLAVLADNRRLQLLPEIAQLFEALRRDAEKRVKVRLRCAAAPSAEQQTALANALRHRYARDVELEVAVDPALLGGAVLDVDGEVVDSSVRARLAQLQRVLTH